ncbi:hypothetical protein [Actinoplanes sp. NPDC051494]|uniref:hypothetical protein n=1 Tax=Actinoplanes sp. NPDC051494 TaxID=3363907 RepID=UPI00379798EC
MSLSDDPSPQRSPLFFPVVIATVFLAIIGISAGFALGNEHSRFERTSAAQTPAPGETDPATVPTPVPDGPECPEQMHATARKIGVTDTLYQVLRVRAASTGTTVWICRDPGGKLYYQANRGGTDAKWVEGETALFLSDVEQDGDTYTATAHDGATFTVNDSELRVVTKTGREEISQVEPG